MFPGTALHTPHLEDKWDLLLSTALRREHAEDACLFLIQFKASAAAIWAYLRKCLFPTVRWLTATTECSRNPPPALRVLGGGQAGCICGQKQSRLGAGWKMSNLGDQHLPCQKIWALRTAAAVDLRSAAPWDWGDVLSLAKPTASKLRWDLNKNLSKPTVNCEERSQDHEGQERPLSSPSPTAAHPTSLSATSPCSSSPSTAASRDAAFLSHQRAAQSSFLPHQIANER